MLLILDAETTMDIESEMSTIDRESLNEKFASDVVDTFSNDRILNSVKDNTESEENIISDCKENNFLMYEKENDETEETVSSNNICNEDNDNNETKELPSENCIENLDENSCTNIEELNEKKLDEKNDINIHQDLELESCNDLSSQNLGQIENEFCQTELTTILDEDIKAESKLSETSDITNEDEDVGIKSFAVVENINENKLIDNLVTNVAKNSQICDISENVKEEQNADGPVIVKSPNSNSEESVCAVLSLIDCGEITPEKNITNEENIAFTVLNENNDITLKAPTGGDSQSNGNSTIDNSAKQNNQENKLVLETESLTVEKIIEKIFVEKIDETKKDKAVECDSKLEEKKKTSLVSKLSNTLDILSDDEDEQHEDPQNVDKPISNDKQCISLEEDDDIMLIDEDTSTKIDSVGDSGQMGKTILEQSDSKSCNVENSNENLSNEIVSIDTKNEAATEKIVDSFEIKQIDDQNNDCNENVSVKPLLPSSFLKTCKKNLIDMTREDLEEFCILKIVESIVDRSNLGDIKTQLKTMSLTVEEYKKKAMMLSKQNRDLQVVLKSVQEEQKKSSVFPITPLKITRSVGMQVLMTDKPSGKRKSMPGINSSNPSNPTVIFNTSNRSSTNQKLQKANTNNQQIPVPRLVPAANNTATKAITTLQTNAINTVKSQQTNSLLPNGIRNSPPAQKPEKRPRIQSVTVDLTDDEPPSKITSRSSPAPPVRLVPPQNLMAPQRQPFATNMNSPRKVYIPISGPQAQNVRPGQTIMLKSVPPIQGPRQRVPPSNSLAKMQSNTIRMNRVQSNRHPAALPDAMKQYQPPNWKALPPAPDLKLSKVENGIVISWKIDGYQEDSYEEIASYQLYAYQETTAPPSTALWKKIGDVKALPLPMACTLTQFMAGYKYYFAVRAVDVKSRLGPFSLPGSILLLNKM